MKPDTAPDDDGIVGKEPVMADEVKNVAEEETADIITLEFDDGKEEECEIMGVFEVDGKEYIALLPLKNEEDVYLYGYVEYEDDTFELLDIEDDAEFAKVEAEFNAIVNSEE